MAVLAVVAYHAGVGRVGGGFVGVDVFHVLSGFLITGLLWEELQATGRLRMGAFYARRARRLLPAAVLVLTVTVAASWAWLSPLQARLVARDAAAAALYVANYRFAVQRTDYLADASWAKREPYDAAERQHQGDRHHPDHLHRPVSLSRGAAGVACP